MRVLFVNENIGGHATVHHNLRVCLDERDDVETIFLDVPAASGLRRVLAASLPLLGRLDLDLHALRAQLAASWWVRRRIREQIGNVDVVHIYTQNAGLLCTGAIGGTPCVVSLDTTNAENAYRLPFRSPTRFTALSVAVGRPIERRVYRRADRIVANSAWAATSLRDVYGIQDDKIITMPFGIVGPDELPARADNTLPRIVFVGRQFEAKGGDLLLEVFERRFAGRAELVLVTQEPVRASPGVTVISDLRQGDGRLWEILAESDIFAFPSSIDQAPNAVIEAMAAGLPVIAVRSAAMQEMVVDESSGLLIEPGDSEGLEAALELMIEDTDRRRSMGSAGRERFELVYDARMATSKLLGIFESLIDHRGAAC